jgi:hypothetical protein
LHYQKKLAEAIAAEMRQVKIGYSTDPAAEMGPVAMKRQLERIERYAPQLRELIAMGVNVIVPVQNGELTMPEFAIRVVDLLGTFDLVWGIPSKKGATSTEDIAAFADWLSYSQLPEVYRPGITSTMSGNS